SLCSIDSLTRRALNPMRLPYTTLFRSHIGDVYPSGLLPIKAGNVRQTPLATIYRESEVLKNLRNPDLYKGKCGVCEFRHVCGGRSEEHTSELQSRFDLVCRLLLETEK